jgi:hypothetical protein
MRKIATMFLIILSIGLMFGGAVSAQEPATVDVAVVNGNGDNVTVATQGDEVAAVVEVNSNDEALTTPYVNVTVDPKTGLQFEPEKAVMWDGTQFINNDMTNYPTSAFFFFDQPTQSWIWDIGFVLGGNMPADDMVALIAPAIVTKTGEITVGADLYQVVEIRDSLESVLVDSDSYTFLAVAPKAAGEPVKAKTIPMKETGTPVALAALGLLSIIGGGLYSRLR